MKPPLLTGQPAPVLPFAVHVGHGHGKRCTAGAAKGDERMARLRRARPDLAALVDRIIDRYLENVAEN